MPAKFLSPGVFTTEVDQSFLAQGVAGIGAAVIGRTLKGPAFVPTFVQGYDDFASRFGPVDPSLQMPYASQNYLKNSNSLTVVRVLGHKDGSSTSTTNVLYAGGWSVPDSYAIIDGSGSALSQVLAVVHSQYAPIVAGVPADANNFVFKIVSGSTTVFAATASFLTSSANYVGKVLNFDPTRYYGQNGQTSYYHYVYRLLRYATPAVSAAWTVAAETGTMNMLRDFTEATTTYVKSQPLGGVESDMFRFHTRYHGLEANNLKIVVQNIKPSPNPLATAYGTFDVIVRDFSDTDQRQVIIEAFVGCTMDPKSPNYVMRRIGDKLDTFDTTQRKFITQGTWKAMSKRIWIELSPNTTPPAEALPWGFRGTLTHQFGVGLTLADMPDIPLVQVQKDRFGNIDPNVTWGVQFISGGIYDRALPWPDDYPINGGTHTEPDFSLSFLSSSIQNGKTVWAYVPALSASAASLQYVPQYASASLQKFAMQVYGGHDGWDIRVADPLYLNNVDDESILGVIALKRAVDTISNPDAFDMNLLGIPGINNLRSTDYARLMVNNRQDAMYVMDVTGAAVTEVIAGVASRQLDDNYTACYYPDLQLTDVNANKVIRVAPSVAVLGAIAFSDRVSQPWFAPAGLNRGGLAPFGITDVVDRLNFQDRNDLYDNRINPIAIFPDAGIVIFGQKTLQVKASALDRINVRRLLIFAKKTIASAAKFLVFEPDNPITWQRFLNLVNPILQKVQQDQGLDRFKVVMDSTTNTPDVVDRNVMVGKIFLQPTKAAEFIDLSFIITNAGVQFGS